MSDLNQPLPGNRSNGKDHERVAKQRWRGALGSTQPTATLGSTLQGLVEPGTRWPAVDETSRQVLLLLKDLLHPEWSTRPERVVMHIAPRGGAVAAATEVFAKVDPGIGTERPKATGQVVLLEKVMQQWGFSEKEAAMLLGFEDSSDIREIYDGRKPVGHRDANDRLRAVLRIAADIDALFDDRDAIRDWLNEPQRDLGGKTPRALLNEGSMENLLQVKYYVSHLSGR